MGKYDVIKKIMDSNRVSNEDKVYCIEMYLKKWSTEEELKWIWE